MTDDDGNQVDWFGNAVRKDANRAPVPAVPCPYCGDPYDSGSELRRHLIAVHGERAASRRPGKAHRVRRWLRSLGYLPFWFVVPLNLGLTAALAVTWRHELAWVSIGFLPAVFKAGIVLLSLVPVTCYLAARVATVGRD